MSTEIIKIRGHHLLCMLGFRGLGYSDDFVINMTQIVDCVLKQPDTMVELVDSCDEICSACPHSSDGICAKSKTSSAKIESKDIAILSYLGYTPGTRVKASDVYSKIALLLNPEDIGGRFCTRCSWRELGYCAKGLAELKYSLSLDGRGSG